MKNRVINWTWSNTKDQFVGFWRMGRPLPPEILAKGDLAQKTKDTFARGADAFFEPLRTLQPLTWKALTEGCSPACLVQDKEYSVLLDIVIVADDLAVFIEPFGVGDDLDDWSVTYAGMPEFLRGYYVNFNGMRASYSNQGSPHNLPANVRKWRRVSDYRSEEQLPKKLFARMAKELGDLEHVDIFLETEWGDLFMLNHNTKDEKVYVAPEGAFNEYFELTDAAKSIDALCAHVLSGSVEPYFLKPPYPRT